MPGSFSLVTSAYCVTCVLRHVNFYQIEGNWSVIKRDLRRRIGRMSPDCRLDPFLVEYVWRSKFENNDFNATFLDFSMACYSMFNVRHTFLPASCCNLTEYKTALFDDKKNSLLSDRA